MTQFIHKVAVTGADDSVEPHQLELIAKEFNFVEFGILVSPNRLPCSRFPSKEWIENLTKHFKHSDSFLNNKISFAGHICGSWINEIFKGNWPHEELSILSAIVSRWQLNTHGVARDFDSSGIKQVVHKQNISDLPKEVIFQYDEGNKNAFYTCSDAGLNVSVLFDNSHGKGRLPTKWPSPLENISCGYAGGLSPHNVAEEIFKIEQVIGKEKIWIDAESHLRSADNSQFDLNKVRLLLKESTPWTIKISE